MNRVLLLLVFGLATVSTTASGGVVTFTATGSPDVSGFIQIDDSTFTGGTFDAVSNTAITGLSLSVLGYTFEFGNVAKGGITYVNSSGPIPLIVNGGGAFASHGLEAIAFFPDGSGGTAIDGDASLALDLDGNFTSPEHVFAVRWSTVPMLLQELLTAVTGTGPGKSLANKVSLAQTYYQVPDVQAACAVLDGFLNEVRAQRTKKLTTEQAAQLTHDAQRIIAAIGCD